MGLQKSNMTWQLYNNNNMIETVIYYMLSLLYSALFGRTHGLTEELAKQTTDYNTVS